MGAVENSHEMARAPVPPWPLIEPPKGEEKAMRRWFYWSIRAFSRTSFLHGGATVSPKRKVDSRSGGTSLGILAWWLFAYFCL